MFSRNATGLDSGYFSRLSRLLTPARVAFLILASLGWAANAQSPSVVTVLYSFQGFASDAYQPNAGVILGTDGNLYGTTTSGGDYLYGTVFKLTLAGDITILHSFDGYDGNLPESALIQASDGSFYGTTDAYIYPATFFKITPEGAFTSLHTFTSQEALYPSTLIQGSDGNFYGTSWDGGSGDGTIFKITPDGQVTLLHSFSGIDGLGPEGALSVGSDGNFYGTTFYGTTGEGSNNYGTAFKITPEGVLTTLHAFSVSDGEYPSSGLTLGNDGNFYGNTVLGGQYSYGTVFRMAPNGTLTVLHDFNGCDGERPSSQLYMGIDGKFYGVTYSSGSQGSIYSFDSDGAFQSLFAFSGTDGQSPSGSLIEASNGIFYGTTEFGFNNLGGVYGFIAGTANVPAAPVPSTPVPGNGQVRLSWNSSAGGACTYNIYEGTSSGQESAAPIQAGSSSQYTISGLTNGITYYFKIAGVNSNGVGQTSSEIIAMPSLGTLPNPTFSIYGGIFSTTQAVTLSDTTPGATIYYTIDGTLPTPASIQYATPIEITTDTVLSATAYSPGYIASGVTTASFRLVTAAPVFTRAGGYFSKSRTIAIADTTPGATIYYSTDGSNPTSMSQIYTTPITITTSTDFIAVAQAPGFEMSYYSYADFKDISPRNN